MFLQEVQALCQVDVIRPRQLLHVAQDFGPLLQPTGGQLANDHGVCPNPPRLQAGLQPWINPVEVIDPD